SFSLPSSFVANLGFSVDIYEGKVLIDQINQMLLPSGTYQLMVGDEVVTVDGRTPEEWISVFSRFRQRGNSLTTRRSAADLITFRPQSVYPRAVETGDSATVVIRRESGEQHTLSIPWTKTGVPLRMVGPVPGPLSAAKAAERHASAAGEDYMKPLMELRNWSVPVNDYLLQGETYTSEDSGPLPRKYVLGWGMRNPRFRLPENFEQRLGTRPFEFHYSGTYESGGRRIGYIRFPNFAPPNLAFAIMELESEVQFFEENTDGLVVDVMRNTGGGCYMLDAAKRLIPNEFYFFGEEIRPTLARINAFQAAIESARRRNADQWVIDVYSAYLEQLSQAYAEYRGRTGPLPACTEFQSVNPSNFMNSPAEVVYTKPLIVLIDEFSTSAGDIFPAMLQDNRRGPLVGTRTSGAGGSISGFPVGAYSESLASNTNSLVVRREPVAVGGYPVSRYLENIGAHPDIPLEYMTRENLLNEGRPFVEAFTRILVERIQASSREASLQE
ncbi:MAG: S41 family peptidase, partial [Bryobacteraceae bacterium]